MLNGSRRTRRRRRSSNNTKSLVEENKQRKKITMTNTKLNLHSDEPSTYWVIMCAALYVLSGVTQVRMR